MFPDLDLDEIIEEELQSEERTEQGITYLFDFRKGDFVIKDGRLVVAEGKEAVKTWIEKILLTEEFKFEIYKDDSEDEYGTTIRELIRGRKLPQILLESELERIIEEKLVQHIEIEGIDDFSTTQDMTTLTISFRVILVDGNSFIQEVSF